MPSQIYQRGSKLKTILALLALSVSTAASSACYSIYAPSNELVWRGTTAPVPMDRGSLKDEVQKKVPEGHMVVVNNDTVPCYPLDLTTRTTMRQKAKEMKRE